MSAAVLYLYSRERCHLCDELEEDLQALIAASQLLPEVRIIRRDVDSRTEWRDAYGLRIPVLTDQRGREICSAVLDHEVVRDWLAVRSAQE